jgi:transcription elongation factor Elf1
MSKVPLTPSQGLDLDNPNQTTVNDGPVECLGKTYENDTVRREYYLSLLAEKLKDPEFRSVEGFPIGEDEDILNLSDPPYYTACPNPFIQEFIDCHGKPYDTNDEYKREPYAVDVSVGKTDALYKAHSYHTKVPHLAIVPSILHYTDPGDVVLDGFCGSGMTGVAAQWCGVAPDEYRKKLESEWKGEGKQSPEWGARRAILNDLSPAASFIAANYNRPFDVDVFLAAASKLLREVESELGWMYETLHTDGKIKCKIDYTVWSEVFNCPDCAGEVVFYESALDKQTKRVKDEFNCPSCNHILSKGTLERQYETKLDPITQAQWKHIKLVPVSINYKIGKEKFEKKLDTYDIEVIKKIESLNYPVNMPSYKFPVEDMYHGSRISPKGFTYVHHFFLVRAAHSLALLWEKALENSDRRIGNMILYFVEQAIWGMSVLARYAPTHYSQVNQYLNGVYYIGSQIVDVSPSYILEGKLKRLLAVFGKFTPSNDVVTQVSSCAELKISDCSIDYIFTDPPFGENIFYADLNYLVESWHKLFTNSGPEAIVDKFKNKGMPEYQHLMQSCFEEYYRVLKPGRWMTVVFHNSKNSVWNAIQEAIQAAGFIVADVRTLDKKQGSYRQVTSSAVKQDLVISVYKPSSNLEEKFDLVAGTINGVWDFVDMHLRQVVTFDVVEDVAITIAERLPHRLFDRMVAFHVQKSIAVPMSFGEFYKGLDRYAKRDEMYFLPEQVAEYDKSRMSVKEVMQLEIAVSDEESAIQWVKQQLEKKPFTFSELQPLFMRERQSGWNKYEKDMELESLLQESFLDSSGESPIPPQILQWMKMSEPTRNKIEDDHKDGAYEDKQGLHTKNVSLLAIANGRWFIPNPENAAQLIEKRNRALLKEFDGYKKFTGKKLKEFRLEVVRAGFFKAYQEKDYKTIVNFAGKLPESAVQDDEKLLRWVDISQTRLSDESLF